MSITGIGARPGMSGNDAMRQKVTTASLREQKLHHEPITCLTAYDYATARLVDEAGHRDGSRGRLTCPNHSWL